MRNSSSRPRRALDPAKRAAILDGARAVFLRNGFARGSVDDVAAEAGVGKQTVYRHFGSKEALVVALVDAMCAPGALAAPPASLTRREQLRSLLRGLVEGVTSDDSLRMYRALVAEAERMPELGRLFWVAGPRQVRTALALAWAGDAAGGEVIAAQLVQLALGDAYQELILGVSAPGPDVFDRQIEAALDLVAA
jgi:AcrR family transcriptional regulator